MAKQFQSEEVVPVLSTCPLKAPSWHGSRVTVGSSMVTDRVAAYAPFKIPWYATWASITTNAMVTCSE